MPIHAATATPDPIVPGLFILTLVIVTLGYVLKCWLWPFTACRRCHGTGRRRALIGGRTFGLCRRCDGAGYRLLIGRRIANELRELHRNSR